MTMRSFLLGSTAFFDKENEGGTDQRTPEQIKEDQRKSIKVTVSRKEEEKPEGEGGTEGATETEEDTGTGEGEQTQEEQVGENEEQIEANADETKKLEAEHAAAKTQKEKDRIQRRIDKLTASNADLKKEVEELNKKLLAKPKEGEGLTEADVEARATQKQIERQFTNDCNKLWKDATKVDKEFDKKVNDMAEEVGKIPGAMIGMLTELDAENGGAVLSYLTANTEEYEEIFDLIGSNKTHKAAVKLEKLSEKIAAEGKPKPKPVSNAPAPMKPVGTGAAASSSTVITGKETMAEFVRKRNLQETKKAEERRLGLRR